MANTANAFRYVIVANPKKCEINDDWVDSFNPIGKGWLSPNKACEIITREPISIDPELAVDVFEVDPLDNDRKKMFLFCDMDSTIVAEETLDRLAQNLEPKVAKNIEEITQKAMEGKLNFKDALKKRVEALRGLKIDLLEKIANDLPLSPGAKTLITTMKRQGAYCVLVSGGFTHVTGHLADKLGFDEHHGNHLVVRDSTIQGDLSGKIQDGEEKGRIVRRILSRFSKEEDQAIAVGDGANDRFMMRYCDMSFSYNGKDILKEETKFHINHTDLTSILYAQGFKDEEIVFCD